LDGLYRRLLDFTHDGVYRYTFDEGAVLMANQGLIDILELSCSPEEVVGRRLRDLLIYTEKQGVVRKALEEAGEIHDFEYHFKTLEGKDKWVLHDSFIVKDPETGRRIVEAIVKDITYRKQAEQALAAEKDRLEVTLRSIGDGVIATDTEGRVTDINKVAEALTGWAEEEALGRPLAEIFHIINQDTRERCVNPVDLVLEQGKVVGLANHTVLLSRDGAEYVIADSGAPIHDLAGKIIGVVLVFRDVTEKHRLEEQVLRSEKLAAIGQLAGGVSHDLRNPLSAIANGAYFLKMAIDGDDPAVRETVDIIQNEVNRAEQIISGLLNFARPKPAERHPTDLGEVVGEVLARIHPPDGVDVAVRIDPAMPMIQADSGQLDQVFFNIITNALQAMPDGGRLTIEGEARDGGVAVAVIDTGGGIPPERCKQVFEPLYTTKRNGIGFGLAVTRQLVENHQGRIEVQSEVGKGSRFTVFLPLGVAGE
jgi:two-component system, cell cycle sensor histidine kinase and response regulator CckA